MIQNFDWHFCSLLAQNFNSAMPGGYFRTTRFNIRIIPRSARTVICVFCINLRGSRGGAVG